MAPSLWGFGGWVFYFCFFEVWGYLARSADISGGISLTVPFIPSLPPPVRPCAGSLTKLCKKEDIPKYVASITTDAGANMKKGIELMVAELQESDASVYIPWARCNEHILDLVMDKVICARPWLRRETEEAQALACWILKHKSFHRALARIRTRKGERACAVKCQRATRMMSTFTSLRSLLLNWSHLVDLLDLDGQYERVIKQCLASKDAVQAWQTAGKFLTRCVGAERVKRALTIFAPIFQTSRRLAQGFRHQGFLVWDREI